MPLIPIDFDDDLYRQLQEAASHKKVSVFEYIKDRLAQPEGEVLEIEGAPGEGIAIQPAAALEQEYLCGFTLSHLRDARQKLLEISIFLGHPLAEIPTRKRGTREDAQWQAQRILTELTWLSQSLEEDAYQVADGVPSATPKANVADDFDPFWMVVRDNGDEREMKTTKRHPAMFLAEHEAERLCDKARAPFLIFQAVARCEAGPTPINWQLAKDHRP